MPPNSMASGAPVVLAGDYNLRAEPQDIYPTRSLDDNALIQPESRHAFARLLAQGWTTRCGSYIRTDRCDILGLQV